MSLTEKLMQTRCSTPLLYVTVKNLSDEVKFVGCCSAKTDAIISVSLEKWLRSLYVTCVISSVTTANKGNKLMPAVSCPSVR